MKNKLGICIFLFGCLVFVAESPKAQVISGITNVPDTSYATWSVFQIEKKQNPQVAMPIVPDDQYVAEKKGMIYRKINERRLVMDVFYPTGNKATGIAVIFVHGGGWRSGNRSQHENLAKALANKGYACFLPEYRLSTEAYYPAAVYDIKEAVKWVKTHAAEFNVDSSKVVIGGFSAGGQLAALIGCTGDMPDFENYDDKDGISTRVKAIIDIDGTLSFVHPESSEFKEPDKVMASSYWFGYTFNQNPVLYASASPLSYALYSPPILFLNSSVERMHTGREDFIQVLDGRGTYSEVHTFADSPHSFCLFEPWFTPTVNYIDDFLKKVFNY